MATANIASKLISDLKRDFGLTDAQAAGVVGNLMHESGGFQSLQEQNPGSGRGGFGYAQWTGARRNAFENYASSNGLDPSSYEANYGYLKHEIATDPYERQQFNTVKAAKTAEEAARLVSENFLRPGTPNLPSRVSYANQALGYAGTPVPPRDIPNAVGTQLSVIPPRVAPTPASVEDRVTARNTAPAPISPLQAALNQYAIREGNRVTPAPVEDRVTARNSAIARNDAINDAARRASLTSTQSYVGQDRAPTRSMFGNDPMTPSNGPVVATIPSATRQPAPMSTAPISYAGQERGIPTVPTRTPGTGLTPSPSASHNITNARSEQAIQRSVGRTSIIPDRLPSSPAGLPALYGTMTPQQVSQIGVPSLAPPAVTPMRTTPATLPRIPTPQAIASAPRIAPTPFQRPQTFGAPMVAPRAPQNPLTIRVIGSNTIPYPQQPMNVAPMPVPKPVGITNQQRLNNARDAVSQSGDTSVGNQRDAAEARSSGAGGRTRRY